MSYRSSAPFVGNVDKALGLAESALTAVGFRITHRSRESLEAVGPGMNSTRESALTGASRVRIRRTPGELEVAAELGGVERMSRFVTLFPLGLCLFLAVVFSLTSGRAFGVGAWIVPGAVALPWLIIGPWMARYIRGRTSRGLDVLLANMVTTGELAE